MNGAVLSLLMVCRLFLAVLEQEKQLLALRKWEELFNMLDPGNQVHPRLGLTPAKAPPKNFKNADKLEFFEVCV